MTDRSVELSTIPHRMHWDVAAASFEVRGDDAFTIGAPPRSDLFHAPDGSRSVENAPRLLFPASAPCMLSARVSVDFQDTFDAGALLVRRNDRTWAKLCLERAPDGRAMVVSVVTHGRSDDCNSHVVEGEATWLRIAMLEASVAFHASDDGERWSLVRHFALDPGRATRIGFSCQAPVGEGCQAHFDGVRYDAALLGDIRSGA